MKSFYYLSPEVLDFTLENHGTTEYDVDKEADYQRRLIKDYFGDKSYIVLKSYDNIKQSHNSPCLVYGYKFQILETTSTERFEDEDSEEELL